MLFCSPPPVKNKCSQLVVFHSVRLPSFLPNRKRERERERVEVKMKKSTIS